MVKDVGDSGEWRCLMCNISNRHKARIRNHVETHFESQQICTICSQVCKTRDSLRKHTTKMHRDNHCSNWSDIIKKCFKLMYSIIRIKLPLRNMDNIWVPFLTNTFSAGPAKSNPSPQERDNMFLVHMATVMDGAAKKWQCCLCGKVSKLKGDILDHVECKHMNTAFLYSCRYCTMVVGTNRKLRLHEVESCTSLLLTLSV